MVERIINRQEETKAQVRPLESQIQDKDHAETDTLATKEEEEKNEPNHVDKVIDQRANNLCIARPELQDLYELLNQTAE